MVLILAWNTDDGELYYENRCPVKAESPEALYKEIHQKVQEGLRKKHLYFYLQSSKGCPEDFKCADFISREDFNIWTLEEWFQEEGFCADKN